MNRFLRTTSTSRLLGAITGIVVAVAAGTTIAIAAQGSGPVPPRKPLAVAIHQALSAPAVTGISARISFTNNLISSSEIQGSDPLLTGGSGRVWITDKAFRLELQGDNGDANVVAAGGSWWAYDPSSNTVYKGRLQSNETASGRGKHEAIPSVSQIKAQLGRLMTHLRISGAIPGDVAGRPTYSVRVSPGRPGGLLGALALAWDALRGVPLRFALYARGDSTPVLSLQATGISYGGISSSVFKISPPTGAKVVTVSLPANRDVRAHQHPVVGLAAVGKHLSFAIVAPASLDGMARQSVTLLGSRAVLITYGRNLGGVAVIEQAARAGAPQLLVPSTSGGGDQPRLTLPTIQVRGTSAQELDTALGTVIRFTRAGVQYTVLGSVRPDVARAAAKSL